MNTNLIGLPIDDGNDFESNSGFQYDGSSARERRSSKGQMGKVGY